LGKKVAALVKDYQKKGAYSKVFVASNLPSSVYIYRLKSGSQYRTSKKDLYKIIQRMTNEKI